MLVLGENVFLMDNNNDNTLYFLQDSKTLHIVKMNIKTPDHIKKHIKQNDKYTIKHEKQF